MNCQLFWSAQSDPHENLSQTSWREYMSDRKRKRGRTRVKQFAGFNVKEPDRLVYLEHQLRVRYAETDAQGIVYYGSYFIYFEEARVEYLRKLGLNYRDLEEQYHPFVVAEAGCRYRAPAYFDDLLTFRTAVARLGRASMTFVYETVREMDPEDQEQYVRLRGISRPIEIGPGLQLVAEGYTTIVAVDENGRPATIDPSIREPIRRKMHRG